jgi:hypothetical protein
MNDKVKEVQEYLEKKGFEVPETAIVDMAIDLTRRLGAGDWTFACEAEARKEKAEERR